MNSVGKNEPLKESLAEPSWAREIFRRFANHGANALGSPWPFLVASTIAIGSTLGGYFFGYAEKWVEVANTAMTIITFLMVFLIQNTQYRETRSILLSWMN